MRYLIFLLLAFAMVDDFGTALILTLLAWFIA